MKLFKRSNTYKASNVTFNPETLEAVSYSWWTFVKMINGKLVFNNHNYSSSTCKHQSKVRSLLRDLGIEIDITVQASGGLQRSTWTEQAVSSLTSKIEVITAALGNSRRKKALDSSRMLELNNLMIEKSELETFISSIVAE